MFRPAARKRRQPTRIGRFTHREASTARRCLPMIEALEERRMLAFTIGTEFTGGSGPGFIPPDTMGAVGPDHVVELINGRAAAYSKTGVQQLAGTLDEFWIAAGVTPAGGFSFDPRVVYDAASGRFFAAAVDNGGGPNNFLVAVSISSDPTDGWVGFQIDADTDDSHWADFPMLGLDNNVLTVSANMFGLDVQATTTSFLVIPKADLLAAVPAVDNATLFENVSLSNTGFTPQPIVDLDSGTLPLPILSAINKPGGFLKTSSIGGTPSTPTLNTAGGLISVTPGGGPPDIDQPGPKVDIDTGDTRFSGNVIKQQIPGRANPSLWGAHTVNIGDRAAIEWYEIDAVTNAVVQSGTIADSSLAFNYPSIAVNDFGDVVIGFSGGGTTTFMSTYVAVGQTVGGVTVFDPVLQTHAGVADYENLDDIGRNRWGDYSATVVDPTNQSRIWTFQEFASGVDEWSIRITEILILPSVSIGDDVALLEGDFGFTDFVFPVSLSSQVSQTVTVFYATVDVTPVAPGDYQAQSGTLTFQPGGPLTQTITIKVIGDTNVEPNETFLVQLSNPTNTLLGRSTAIGTILNDDVDVTINDVTVIEGNSGTTAVVFVISANGAINQTITVSYASLNQTAQGATDYLPLAGFVTLTAAVPTALVTAQVVGDRLDEDNETFYVALTNSQGARIAKSLGVATILDDDPLPSLYVNDVQVTTTAAGTFAAVFTVGLDSVSGRAVTVNFSTSDFGAISGVDYAGLTGSLTFQPGVRTQTVLVPIMTGAVYSADKKFHLNLSSAQNASMADPQGMATIVFGNGPVGERIIDNGDAGYGRGNGWTTLTNTLAYGLDYDYHAAGNGSSTASYTFTGLSPGSYEVYAKWIPFSNRATNAPFTILNGGTPVGTVIVNQQAAPVGDVSNGVTWQKLGTFDASSGMLVVRLGDNANGYVVADAVRLVADGIADQHPEINVAGLGLSINDGDNTPDGGDGTEFGNVNLNTDSSPHTFTVVNNGNALLQLGGSPRVLISGANAADFLVTLQPAAGINPNGSTNFEILFRPTAAGLRQAVVTIANDDSDEGPYSFTIQGTGVAVASPFAHNQQFPQDVNADQRVSASDALILVNRLLLGQSATPLAATTASSPTYYPDVNADGRLSTGDLLMVINYILRTSAAPQAAPAAEPLAAPAVDDAFVLFDDTADLASDEPAARIEVSSGGSDHGGTSGSHASAPALMPAAVGAALSVDEDDESTGDNAELEWDLLALDS